jgi:hypothetical protein
MDIIRQQLYRLARQKVTGLADIRTFAGRFCLLGNALEGYSPAPETASTYLNAGEWNRAAITNNRVEIRVH